MLSGKKTYIVGVLMIVFCGLGYILGYLEPTEATTVLLEALAIMGLRHGMVKE